MSDWPHEGAGEWVDRARAHRPTRPFRPWRTMLLAVALMVVAVGVFAQNIGDDGYSFDAGCGTQGATCSYSSAYSLRQGHDTVWTFLGDFGPGAVTCPTVSDAAAACWYYGGGIAPAGAARAAAGPGVSASTPTTTSVGTVQLVLPDFLNLSASDGQAIGTVILTTWAAAFAWRMVIKALNVADHGSSDD